VSRIILTGGTGLIGRALLPALRQAGYEPIVLSRRSVSLPEAEVVPWDGVRFPSSLPAEEEVAVINLAGAGIADRRWTPAYKQVLWESRVQATQAAVAWLRDKAPSGRLISASAIGYYGSGLSSARLTEESPPGKDFLAGLAQAWEAAAQEAPTPPVLLRLGVVLSRTGGAWPRLRQGLRAGIATYFAPGTQGFSWVHIQDVVRAFLWALTHPEAQGPYNVTAPNPVSARAFAEIVGRHLKSWLVVPLPAAPLRWILGELADTLTRGAYVLPARLEKAGFSFQYPTLEAALQELWPKPS